MRAAPPDELKYSPLSKSFITLDLFMPRAVVSRLISGGWKDVPRPGVTLSVYTVGMLSKCDHFGERNS